MFKNLVRNLSSFFEMYQNKEESQYQVNEEYVNNILKPILEEIKKELSKLAGIKEIAIYSVTGILVAKDQINKGDFLFNFENLSSVISDVQQLKDKYSSNSVFTYILLDDVGLFIKKPRNKDFYLVILTDKSVPIGALVSFLNRFEVE